ncbi:MAG: hypothetical protein ACRC7O_05975, partial [Fimbriiglobus sp.]
VETPDHYLHEVPAVNVMVSERHRPSTRWNPTVMPAVPGSPLLGRKVSVIDPFEDGDSEYKITGEIVQVNSAVIHSTGPFALMNYHHTEIRLSVLITASTHPADIGTVTTVGTSDDGITFDMV